MGLKSAFKSLVKGNVQDALNFAFVDEQTVEASNQADRALMELNREDMIEGKISQNEFERRAAAIDANAFPQDDGSGGLFTQESSNPWAGFKEGAVEGLQAEAGFVNKTVGGALDFASKAIPWQLWVILAIYLAIILVPRLIPERK